MQFSFQEEKNGGLGWCLQCSLLCVRGLWPHCQYTHIYTDTYMEVRDHNEQSSETQTTIQMTLNATRWGFFNLCPALSLIFLSILHSFPHFHWFTAVLAVKTGVAVLGLVNGGDDSRGVVGSDHLPQSQEEGIEEKIPVPSSYSVFFHAMEHGMDGRCLCMCTYVCVCYTTLVHRCLVSNSPNNAPLPCQRMMAYLLHTEPGTRDSDTPIKALMCQGPGHRWTGGG